MEELDSERIIKLLEQHSDKLRDLGVLKIGLFGSQGRGEARPDSDIDVLVTLADDRFNTYADLKIYLEELLDHEVDLVVEDALKPRLRPYILNEVQYAEGFASVP
jgi:predicted nucleotidyltransferase